MCINKTETENSRGNEVNYDTAQYTSIGQITCYNCDVFDKGIIHDSTSNQDRSVITIVGNEYDVSTKLEI